MLDFLRRIFKSLFGSSDGQSQPEPQAARPPQPQTATVAEPEPEPTANSEGPGPGLWLQRISSGPYDILGRLYWDEEFIAYTLETPEGNPHHLPVGTYPLYLRQEGGRHATYQFRFGEMHQGLIALQDTGLSTFPTLHVSNIAAHLYGSIAVGQSVKNEEQTEQPRELWHSEGAYRQLYLKVLPQLKDETALSLTVAAEN